MGIKQVLYNAKKRLIEKNTPKIQLSTEQKIIVIFFKRSKMGNRIRRSKEELGY